jgi:sensor histidine kinase YesM
MQFIVSIAFLGLCVHKLLECDRGEIEKRIAFITLQIALILDFCEVGHRMVYPRPIFKIVFMVVLVFYLFNGARVAVMNNQAALKNKKLEKELENSRISVMLSQIQPHFLYNSLTSVMDLCDSNPKEAKRAIADFADYLRGNLNSLKTQTPIPFSKEFEHIQKYLKLEKLRFKEELEIDYDIETVDFMLPALSVQPLVENAVKHGVGARPGGGKVRICTMETATEYVVTIEDNGIGFDLNAIKEDGKTHVGLENIQNRLSMMMNAKLEIESQIDVGTVARVIIHKGDN